jgi:hypothetical protein
MSDDPQVNDKEAQRRPADQPPGLPARRSVLLGDILLTIRTALRVFMDLPSAVRTRNGWFVVAYVL